MTERQSKLGVTQEAVDASLESINHLKDESFVAGVKTRIQTEQPALFAFTDMILQEDFIEDPWVYALGVTLTYDALPKRHTEVPLTVSEIEAMRGTFIENAKLKEDVGGKQKAVVNLRGFVDKLEEDSPDLVNLAEASLGQFKGEGEQQSFILGVISVAMPFFMRAEAQKMEQTFFGDSNHNGAHA